jgi:transposase
VALLKQIKGVGTLIALTLLLTLEDPHRFGKSRDVGCYLGLQPGIESLSERIRECNERIEKLASQSYPQAEKLWAKRTADAHQQGG